MIENEIELVGVQKIKFDISEKFIGGETGTYTVFGSLNWIEQR